ncbi:MAG: phosphate ABC transporter substrate-binding protein PstS [Verrucomicrobiae bacterium]|nr:phosphate ABC transporter substrate-binding protein PstS [Verrucomicrobiae bacterium]
MGATITCGLAAFAFASCGGGDNEGGGSSSSAKINLNGSGASFPQPIYAQWFSDFSKKTDGIRVDYQAKGSGAGIQDFTQKVVDFAGSDAAMNDEELSQVEGGSVLLPITGGEVVLMYNLPGVKELKLPRAVYPEIFLGKVTKWNDPTIAAANPGVELPDTKITVVTRSDSSGTTYVFTKHLSAISPDFEATVGTEKAPNWPGVPIKAPKNDGVAAQVTQNVGAIGYVEYGFAKGSKWEQIAALENKAGKFLVPGPESGAAALGSAEFPEGDLPHNEGVPNLIVWTSDPASEAAYPIASFTWMLCYRDMDDNKAAAIRELIKYCVTDGQSVADELGYIPLPDNVKEKVLKAAELIQ